MGMLFGLIFIAPISLFYHPDVMHNGVCYAVPGTYSALWCPVGAPVASRGIPPGVVMHVGRPPGGDGSLLDREDFPLKPSVVALAGSRGSGGRDQGTCSSQRLPGPTPFGGK